MAQNTQLQERYASLIEAKLRKESIFANLFNNRYEGNPKAGAVKVPVRADATAANYDIALGTSLTVPTTSYQTIVLDQDKAINELIDGYVAAAVSDNMVADRLDSAANALAESIDAYLLDMFNDATGEYVSDANIIKSIIKTCAKAKAAGVKPGSIWVAIAPDVEADIVTDSLFVHASADVKDGVIGKLAGYPVYVSNRMAAESFIVGNRDFCHFVDEFSVLPEVVDLKDGVHIGSSAVQGRKIYGGLLSKPATVFVKGSVPSV